MKTTLKSLRIFPAYGETGYRVTAEFDGRNKVELSLGDELATKIVELCAEEIVAAIRETANAVTTESLLRGPEVAAKELEHKP